MAVHLITYYMMQQHSHSEDHHHEHGENCGCGGDPDYDLVAKIETLGRWAQFTPTGFLIKSELTSDEILEQLLPTIGNRDILFVTKVDAQDMAASNPQIKEWVVQN